MTCIREASETPLFKQNFTNWLNKDETTSLVKPKKISTGGEGEGREERGGERGKSYLLLFELLIAHHVN